MRGLPSHFGTQADIQNCIEEDPAGTKVMLQRLLDGRYGWVRVEVLAENDPGLNDEMHEVRVEPVDPNADLMATNVAMHRVQYEKKDDQLSQLFRLGLTVKGVQFYIRQCEGRPLIITDREGGINREQVIEGDAVELIDRETVEVTKQRP